MKLFLLLALITASTVDQYTHHETKNGEVSCPKAEYVEDATDDTLASMVIPQEDWAIDYCEELEVVEAA